MPERHYTRFFIYTKSDFESGENYLIWVLKF